MTRSTRRRCRCPRADPVEPDGPADLIAVVREDDAVAADRPEVVLHRADVDEAVVVAGPLEVAEDEKIACLLEAHREVRPARNLLHDEAAQLRDAHGARHRNSAAASDLLVRVAPPEVDLVKPRSATHAGSPGRRSGGARAGRQPGARPRGGPSPGCVVARRRREFALLVPPELRNARRHRLAVDHRVDRIARVEERWDVHRLVGALELKDDALLRVRRDSVEGTPLERLDKADEAPPVRFRRVSATVTARQRPRAVRAPQSPLCSSCPRAACFLVLVSCSFHYPFSSFSFVLRFNKKFHEPYSNPESVPEFLGRLEGGYKERECSTE